MVVCVDIYHVTKFEALVLMCNKHFWLYYVCGLRL